ncbi:MAG: zinc-binding dehydrogenase [Rhodospirillales bacterium]|nr:MAG: zinc-binding dehydrogenase [Rhodospirillales bacterium]
MKAVVFTGDRQLALMEFDDPSPGPGEVVLEMKASGMCGTDLKTYRAPKGGAAGLGLAGAAGPVIAGHEPCGVVCAVGAGVPAAVAWIGQRAMCHHYKGCGVCRHCLTGWAQLCAKDGMVVYGANGHGGHARYMKVPASTLVTLPDALSFETGAAISCGTGTAFGALQRIDLSGRDTIAIFGQGPVGLSATQFAVAMGARVIALDVSPERLARAKEFGADAVVDPRAVDPVAAIRDLTSGEGAHKSLDTSGAPDARAQAVRALRTWGVACFVGEGGTLSLDVSPDLLRRQISIVGSWTFSTVGQADCARFVEERRIDVDHLFTHRWRLDQAAEAYEVFDKQNTGKGVFLM